MGPGALQPKADRPLREHTVGVVLGAGTKPELRSHELVARRKVFDGDGVQQKGLQTVEGDAVPAHESGVMGIEAHVVLGEHGGVRLADEELAIVVDGQGGRANRDGHALAKIP